MKSMELEMILKSEQALAKAHLEMDITTIDALLHEDNISIWIKENDQWQNLSFSSSELSG